ncbi:hypothetical protein G6F55_014509 [Rhizopus delemar]|nr:hypothetical protein G6F55_014509 [Rhizopus delemar]
MIYRDHSMTRTFSNGTHPGSPVSAPARDPHPVPARSSPPWQKRHPAHRGRSPAPARNRAAAPRPRTGTSRPSPPGLHSVRPPPVPGHGAG